MEVGIKSKFYFHGTNEWVSRINVKFQTRIPSFFVLILYSYICKTLLQLGTLLRQSFL